MGGVGRDDLTLCVQDNIERSGQIAAGGKDRLFAGGSIHFHDETALDCVARVGIDDVTGFQSAFHRHVGASQRLRERSQDDEQGRRGDENGGLADRRLQPAGGISA